MIQKNYPANWGKKEPWRFIPRRDLFPDAIPPPNRETVKEANPSARPMGSTETPKKITRQPAITIAQQNHRLQNHLMTPVKINKKAVSKYFILLVGGWLLLEFIDSQSYGTKLINEFNLPKGAEMLKSIGPYLEGNQQDAVYTAAGIMEAMYLMKSVMTHTYQNHHRAVSMQVPANPGKCSVEALKAIKPYIEPDSRKQLDQALNLYEGANKIHQNIVSFQNNKIPADDQKTFPLKLAAEILNVIRPVLPKEHKEQADKTLQVIKMAEIIEAANHQSPEDGKSTKNKQDGEKEKTSNSTDKISKVMHSFSPMLNDEQKESMNMIMKMAKLLFQPENENDSISEGQ